MADAGGAPGVEPCLSEQDCPDAQSCERGVCGPGLLELATFPDCSKLLLESAAPSGYVLDAATGTLWSFPLGAVGEPLVIATGLSNANAFTLAGDVAYVATDSGIRRVEVPGGAVSAVSQGEGPVHGVAEADGKLYYSSGSELRTIDASAQSGTGQVLATAMNGGLPSAVVVTGGYAVFNADASFNIESVQLDSQMHVKLAASRTGMLFGHRSLLSDGQYVHWQNDGFLHRTPVSDAQGEQHTGFCVYTASAIAFTPQAVYCASASIIEKSVMGMDQAELIASDVPNVTSMIVDPTYLYFANGCQLFRTPL